eukprot:2148509-Pleurochrysis_carterae.AAC.6
MSVRVHARVRAFLEHVGMRLGIAFSEKKQAQKRMRTARQVASHRLSPAARVGRSSRAKPGSPERGRERRCRQSRQMHSASTVVSGSSVSEQDS